MSALARLARGGALNLAGALAGGLAGIALVIVVTNGFPQEIAGTLFAATSLFLIVAAVCGLGADAGLSHLVQRVLAGGGAGGARAVLPVALVPVLALSLPLAVAGWLAAPVLAGLLGGDPGAAGTGPGTGPEGTGPGPMTSMLRVLAVTLPVATSYDTVLAATRAYGTMRANVLVEKLGRLPLQILAVAAVWMAGLGPVWLAVAWAVPYLIGLAGAGWAYRRIVRRGLEREQPQGREPTHGSTGPDRRVLIRPDSGLARAFWSFTGPRALGRICQVALQRADIVLVAALLSPQQAAIYAAATRFLTLGQLGTQAIQQVLQPQLAGLFARRDLAGAREVYRASTAWLMALAWPVYLSCAVFAPLLLQVFGEGYASGHATLVILALTMLVATACGPSDVALLMAGRSRQSLFNNATALVVDVVLAVWLIPVWGITGAAVAWAAALVTRNVLPLLQVWRAYGLLAVSRGVAWVAASAGVCFGAVPLAVTWFTGWYTGTWLPEPWLHGSWLPEAWFSAARNSGEAAEAAAAANPAQIAVAAVTLGLMCVAYGTALWKGRRPLGLAAFRRVVPHRMRVGISKAVLRKPGLAEVPVDRLLLGQQDGMTVQKYAEETGDLLWGSTLVSRGPHAELLRLTRQGTVEVTDEEILGSSYGTHARRCLRLTGRYFWANDEAGIVDVARAFLARAAALNGQALEAAGQDSAGSTVPDGVHAVEEAEASDKDGDDGEAGDGEAQAGDGAGGARAGQSRPGDPILVAPIRDSDCFQVLDGHHRLALAAVRGDQTVQVSVKRTQVTTPLQDHLLKMSWIGGTKELYQPVGAPELGSAWSTVRQCTDRLDKMAAFLDGSPARADSPDGESRSYLDVASCYGWFVTEMLKRGFDGYGVERDPLARTLGAAIYGLDPDRIHTGDAVDFLRTGERRWDVVSCFSLLHHFVLGRGNTTAEELVRLLDDATGSVLFLDTGQEHERWFRKSLAGWNPERITTFLRENTTFDEIIDLGPDDDAKGRYAGNYGRHLFACVRTA